MPFEIAGGSWKREDALVDVSPAEAARSNLPGKCHRHSVGLYRSLFHGISHQSKLLSQVRCGSSEVFMATLLGKSLDWLWSIGFVHSSLNFHQRLCVLGMIDFISSHGLIKSQQATLLTHIIWMGQWWYSIFFKNGSLPTSFYFLFFSFLDSWQKTMFNLNFAND